MSENRETILKNKLVPIALIGSFIAIIAGLWALTVMGDQGAEVSMIRLVAAISSGILLLLFVSGSMYYASDPEKAGEKIFKGIIALIMPIITAFIGFIAGN